MGTTAKDLPKHLHRSGMIRIRILDINLQSISVMSIPTSINLQWCNGHNDNVSLVHSDHHQQLLYENVKKKKTGLKYILDKGIIKDNFQLELPVDFCNPNSTQLGQYHMSIDHWSNIMFYLDTSVMS